MSGGGVMAVFAHPDDESLLAGGTLAACAAAGHPVEVICMTHGERGSATATASARDARPSCAQPAPSSA